MARPDQSKFIVADDHPLFREALIHAIGFSNMPRISAGAYGASERMVVSPGHEENGIFQMPSGQSGHPLSPYFNKGHENWVSGKRTPFLPGPAEWTLVFQSAEDPKGRE